eukprot:Gb_00201 [translate_table: standard]
MAFAMELAPCCHHYYHYICGKFKHCRHVYPHFSHLLAAIVHHRTFEGQPIWKLQANRLNTLCREAIIEEGSDQHYSPPDSNAYASLLEASTNTQSLRQVHAHIFTTGLDQDIFLGAKLVSMYAMCGSVENARLVFDKIYKRNVFLWNAMIRVYARNGPSEEALAIYYQMQQTGTQPDKYTFPFVLKACGSLSALQEGKVIHDQIVRNGFELDVFIGTALVDMYAKCGSIKIAHQLFDRMSERNVVSWNAIIAGYAQNGHCDEALSLFKQMQLAGVEATSATMVSVLSAYGPLEPLPQGKCIHDYIIKYGLDSDIFVVNSLVAMYAKCGNIECSRQVFDKMSQRDVVSWNAMIVGYAQNGHANEALKLFNQMQLERVTADAITMASVLQSCAQLGALQQGKCSHSHVIQNGFESDTFVGTALIDMYAKCGDIEVAWQLFEKMFKRDAVSWNAMIAGFAKNGYANDALMLFNQMLLPGIKINSITMVSILLACAHLALFQKGKWIHGYIIRNGFELDVFVGAALIDMYVKCGRIDIAREWFDKMSKRDVVLWNAMIVGYAQNGDANEILTLFNQMQLAGMVPDSVTIVSVLQVCADLGALQQGKWINDYIIQSGFEFDVFVGTALIDMYSKCGSIDTARQSFGKLSKKDVASWTAMIAGYAQNGYANEALILLNQMQLLDLKPNSVTIVSVLPACAQLVALQQGKSIHGYIIKSGLDPDVSVGTALIDMYAKCKRLDFAYQVFDNMFRRNVISWNAMIAGYAQNGYAKEALSLFYQMQVANMMPDPFTMVSVLQACAHLGAMQQGKWIHDYIIQSGFELDAFVGTALIDFYAKCGKIEIARQLFDSLSKRNDISWNAMIVGYAQNGYGNKALTLFNEMQLADMQLDVVTVVSVLSACAHLAALQQGMCIHGYIIRNGFESDAFVGTALVDMYAKCGVVKIARNMFDKIPERNVSAWNAMIAGYGMHGHGEDALGIFSQMQHESIKPDHVTFISVLSACSHAGLVHEGYECFDCMSRDYCITPRMEHYACMVDLLGRSGRLDEAEDFIGSMPLEPDASVWGSLLGACRNHCNIELGERVAEHLFDLEPENAGYYVLLSNIYASSGRWNEVAKVRAMMKDRGLEKTPGQSLIELNNRLHYFVAGDTSHPQSEKIYATLESLAGQMKQEGYVPSTHVVLHNAEEEVKEHMLLSHSEKLAIAFGLINTSPGTPIRITKNLRVCDDCHNATKFISNIVRREIIVRDANRFHHFKDGLCSCRDFW